MRANVKQAAGTGGFVGAACVACCAPPIIAALGVTLGLVAVAGLVLGIGAAVALAILGVTAVAARRRRGSDGCVPLDDRPVAVATPVRRSS